MDVYKWITGNDGKEVRMNLSVITLIFRILLVLEPVWSQVLKLIEQLQDEDREDLRAAVEFIASQPKRNA